MKLINGKVVKDDDNDGKSDSELNEAQRAAADKGTSELNRITDGSSVDGNNPKPAEDQGEILSTTQTAKASTEGHTAGGDVQPDDNSPEATALRLEQALGATMFKDKVGYLGGQKPDPSATTLGVEQGKFQHQDTRDELALQAAANNGVSQINDEVVYTSHPIANLHLGPYHFDKGTLRLAPDQVADFEALLDKLPMSESRGITKINIDKVDDIVKARFGGMPGATKQFDSSVGRQQQAELSRDFPKVGTVAIDGPTGHANPSQTDNNVEIPVSDMDLGAGTQQEA